MIWSVFVLLCARLRSTHCSHVPFTWPLASISSAALKCQITHTAAAFNQCTHIKAWTLLSLAKKNISKKREKRSKQEYWAKHKSEIKSSVTKPHRIKQTMRRMFFHSQPIYIQYATATAAAECSCNLKFSETCG